MDTRPQGSRRGCLCGIPAYCLSSRQGLGPESVGSPVTSGSVSEALSPRAAPSRCASFATSGRCKRRTWSRGDFRATAALDGGRQTDTYLISQATPSPSRSSSSRYPGSPRCKGAAPDSFAFRQLGKYVLSCFGSSAGAGAAAPPPACVVASGVGSGSCVVDGAGDSDRGACVVGIGDGVGLVVGDGVGLGVGDGEGVGVGDGDGEAVTVGDVAGAGAPASSAKDGIPHPARPAQVAMAKAADADLTTIL